MKQFSSFVVAALMSVAASAQVSVGTTSPDPSARFEVNSSTQGFLGPRVALTSTTDVTTIKNSSGTTVTPATGLMVYNTATAGTGSTSVTPGYYSFNGSSWVRMSATPSEEVSATSIGSFPTSPMSLTYGGGEQYSYSPLGEISLPPGKWEITGEFLCVIAQLGFTSNMQLETGYGWYARNLYTVMNTYWISDNSTASGIAPIYPLFLSGLSSGAPTSDKLFPGSNVAILNIDKSQSRQQMKFYITNSGATSKTYYLHWHESYQGLSLDNNDNTPFYAATSAGTNRLYAVKIQ